MQTVGFTFDYIKNQYIEAQEMGYQVITCRDYPAYKSSEKKVKTLVNRIDVDFSVKKAEKLVDIFNELGIKGTFFIRLHAHEYNPLAFENYRILKKLLQTGHELGYHSEVIDQSVIWDEDAEECLLKDIALLNKMFDTKISGIASHGGITGLNNLDFWKDRKAADYGLLYEAYDSAPSFNLFQEAFYISDSEWTRWKCYNRGKLVQGDHRNPAQHFKDAHPLIYLLIHPDTYYQRHIYE